MRYLPTLDGWRAVAILLVIAYHSLFGDFDKGSTAYSLVAHGAKGVDLFFALSGLLITSRMLEEIRKRGSVRLAGFYIRRAFRILPPYLCYLAVLGFLASAGVIAVSSWEWRGCLLFFRNYVPEPDSQGWLTAHFWSLSVEEHFYLCWPILLVLMGKVRGGVAILLLGMAVPVWRSLDTRFQIIPLPVLGRTDLCIDALLWGAVVAMLVDDPAVGQRIRRFLTMPAWFGLLALTVANGLLEPPLGRSFQAFVLPWLILGTVFHSGSLVGRFLEWGPLRWVGRLSYSLYIWQQLCISGIWRDLGIAPEWSGSGHLLFGIPATFLIGALSYYFLELPLVNLGRKLAERTWPPGKPLAVPGASLEAVG